jgi:hypothetical protein
MAKDPIVLSVAEYFQLKGLDAQRFPVTVEVRDQLEDLLLETGNAGPQLEALFSAIMTTVMNLELAILDAESNSRALLTRLDDLETRIRTGGIRLARSELERLQF